MPQDECKTTFQYDVGDLVAVDKGGQECYKILDAIRYNNEEIYVITNVNIKNNRLRASVSVDYLNKYNHLRKLKDGKYAIRITNKEGKAGYLYSLNVQPYNYGNMRSWATEDIKEAVLFVSKKKAEALVTFIKVKGFIIKVIKVSK